MTGVVGLLSARPKLHARYGQPACLDGIAIAGDGLLSGEPHGAGLNSGGIILLSVRRESKGRADYGERARRYGMDALVVLADRLIAHQNIESAAFANAVSAQYYPRRNPYGKEDKAGPEFPRVGRQLSRPEQNNCQCDSQGRDDEKGHPDQSRWRIVGFWFLFRQKREINSHAVPRSDRPLSGEPKERLPRTGSAWLPLRTGRVAPRKRGARSG